MLQDNKTNDSVERILDTKTGTAFATLMLGIAMGVAGGEMLIPDAVEAQLCLRTILKNPEKTEQLINKLNTDSLTQEFLADPEVVKNINKLTSALEGHVRKSLDERMKQLREKKELLKDTIPGKWTDKAIQGKSGQKPIRITE